jgi:hypothetical protein
VIEGDKHPLGSKLGVRLDHRECGFTDRSSARRANVSTILQHSAA